MTREQILDRYKGFVYNLSTHEGGKANSFLLHMILGIVTEAGELADAVKHVVGYNQMLDQKNVKEEMGDLLFYMQGVCNFYGWEINELMVENMEKLNERYPSGWTQKDAIDRKDKK